jgi:DNA-binding NtrC family response regulator
MRLLWLDDEHRELRDHVRALERHGIQITTARTVDGALSKLHQAVFDVVMVDLLLPPPDNKPIEFIEAIQQAAPNSLVVVVSGYLDNDEFRRAFSAFDVMLVEKPLPEPDSERFTGLVGKLKATVAARGRSAEQSPMERETGIPDSRGQRLIDALELKPRIFGIGIDLKKLFAPKGRS